LDPSNVRKHRRLRERRRRETAGRAREGQDRRSRWAWACVVVGGDTGGGGVLAESSRRYATFGAERRHKVMAGRGAFGLCSFSPFISPLFNEHVDKMRAKVYLSRRDKMD
jgi:hypothetical protein